MTWQSGRKSRWRKTVRWATLAIAFACLATPLSSCGGADAGELEAEHVAVKWLKAMAASDVKTACRLMDAGNHRIPPPYPNWSPAKSCREGWLHVDHTPLQQKPKRGVLGGWGDPHPKVLDVVIDGSRATVVVEGLVGEDRPVWLRKEDGRWLVDRVEYSI